MPTASSEAVFQPQPIPAGCSGVAALTRNTSMATPHPVHGLIRCPPQPRDSQYSLAPYDLNEARNDRTRSDAHLARNRDQLGRHFISTRARKRAPSTMTNSKPRYGSSSHSTVQPVSSRVEWLKLTIGRGERTRPFVLWLSSSCQRDGNERWVHTPAKERKVRR